jgi:hypothetical protein
MGFARRRQPWLDACASEMEQRRTQKSRICGISCRQFHIDIIIFFLSGITPSYRPPSQHLHCADEKGPWVLGTRFSRMADAAERPAANAEAADTAPRPLGWMQLAINIGVMYMLWSQMSGRDMAAGANATTTASGSAALSESGVASSAVGLASANAVATAKPSSAASADPLSPFSILEVMKESSSGKRRITDPALLPYEEDRLARMESARASGKALHNIWPLGSPFDLYVYLSDRADPIRVFETPEEAEARRDEAGIGRIAPPPPSGLEDDEDDEGEGAAGGGKGSGRKAGKGSPSVLANITFEDLALLGSTRRSDGQHSPPLFWHQQGLTYDWSDTNAREQKVNVSLPASALEHNASIYAHIYFCALGSSPDPSSLRYSRPRVIHAVHPLTKFLKQRPKKKTVNLLTGEGDEAGTGSAVVKAKQPVFGIGLAPEPKDGEGQGEGQGQGQGQGEGGQVANAAAAGTTAGADAAANQPVLPYWKPTLHLQLIVDHSKVPVTGAPPHFLASLDADPVMGGYRPPLHVNEFWLLTHHLVGPVNETIPVVPLTISYSGQEMWKWALQSQMQSSWDAQTTMGMSGEGESDVIKSILTDADPYLLVVTAVVTCLHTLFEFLAFRNDISFWRGAKSLEGVSVRSLMLQFVQMLIITLYLFENETSYMILVTQVIGLAIEVWKLRKAIAVNLSWNGWWPRIDLTDKDEGYANSRTKEYDDRATHHMLIVLFPLVIGYAIYSLFYDRHRSWYSWVVTSAVNYVYLFGFVSLTPQLYVNYRLRSVAHMVRRLTWKERGWGIGDEPVNPPAHPCM